MKKIGITVSNCSECPYCDYDGYYDCSRDSGYDCTLSDKRIIDDWDWDNQNNPNRLNQKVKLIPIPEWCELKDVEEEQIKTKKEED